MSAGHNDFYGITAQFESEEHLVKAARRMMAEGFRQIDTFSSYPIEGMAGIIQRERSFAPLFMLIGGLIGGLTGYGMELYAMGYFYPLNVGGRPLNSWPLFVPITFELTVLFSAFAGVIALLVLNRLPSIHHPLFSVPGFDRSSSDHFFLCVEASDPTFDQRRIRGLLESLHAIAITEVHKA
jgi:ActD protein